MANRLLEAIGGLGTVLGTPGAVITTGLGSGDPLRALRSVYRPEDRMYGADLLGGGDDLATQAGGMGIDALAGVVAGLGGAMAGRAMMRRGPALAQAIGRGGQNLMADESGTLFPRLAPDIADDEIAALSNTQRKWLKGTDRALGTGHPYPYAAGDMTAEQIAAMPADEIAMLAREERLSRYELEKIIGKLRSRREAGKLLSEMRFAQDSEAIPGAIIRRPIVGGNPVGETVTIAEPGIGDAARRLFPQIIGEGEPVHRFQEIALDEAMRGKGIGQRMLLDALAQREPGAWYYNSQLFSPATDALRKLMQKKMVSAYHRAPYVGVTSDLPYGDLGPWLARLSEQGMEEAQRMSALVKAIKG